MEKYYDEHGKFSDAKETGSVLNTSLKKLKLVTRKYEGWFT